MNALWSTISENVQFVLLCLGVTAAVVLLAWGSEKLVMKKRHRLNTAHTITTIGMLAAISGVLMVIELPLFSRRRFTSSISASCRSSSARSRWGL